MRDFDYRSQIEVCERRSNRRSRLRRREFLPQLRVQLIELPHFAISTPTEIAVPCVPQVVKRESLESTSRVKSRSHFSGGTLVVNKTVLAGRVDGLFVQTHRLKVAMFNPGELGAHKRKLVAERRRTILRPLPELRDMGYQQVVEFFLGIG